MKTDSQDLASSERLPLKGLFDVEGIILLAILLLADSGSAQAQTGVQTGPDGGYQGSAQYNPSTGGYTLIGPSGGYNGQITPVSPPVRTYTPQYLPGPDPIAQVPSPQYATPSIGSFPAQRW